MVTALSCMSEVVSDSYFFLSWELVSRTRGEEPWDESTLQITLTVRLELSLSCSYRDEHA